MEKGLKFKKIQFWTILILVLIGIGMCVELGVVFYKANFLTNATPSFCTVSELIDCDGVAATTYSVSAGIPNFLWGMILYCVMLMLLFVDRIQMKFKNTIFDVFEHPSSYISFFGVLSFAISMILAFISIFKIHKICALCFCTYLVDLLIAFFARSKEGFIHDILITGIDFVKGAKKYFLLFIVVLISFVSALIYFDKSLIFSPKLKKERQQKEFYADKNKYAIKGNTLGNKDAKVIIKIYSDYYCPFCRVVNTMLHKAAKERNILIEEVNFPLDTSCNTKIGMTLGGHENSCIASRYVLAAKNQGKLWGVANAIFEKRPKNEAELIEVIKKARLGLDIEKLKNDAYSMEVTNRILEDIEKTYEGNIMGTPAMEINGILYMGAMPYEELLSRIDIAQKRAEK